MRYQTTDFLRDSYPFADFIFDLTAKTKKRFKDLFNKAVEIKYDELIFRILDNIFFGFLIIYLGFILVFTLEKYLEKPYGTKISTITTNSMYPAIKPGSIVVSIPTTVYKVGDIINYKETIPSTGLVTGRAITHRIAEKIIKSEKTYFIAKGDSNDQPDFLLINQSDISGKVIYIIPYLGYFDAAIKTIPGFIIFILIPFIMLLSNEVKYIRKTFQRFSNA